MDNQTLRNIGIGVGATLGIVALPFTIFALGLTAVGPIAGGAFAACQAGGLVAAGGALATAQSIAMGGSIVTATVITATTTVAGAATGAAIGNALGGLQRPDQTMPKGLDCHGEQGHN